MGSSVIEDDYFDNLHSNDQNIWASHAKYVKIKAKTNKQ